MDAIQYYQMVNQACRQSSANFNINQWLAQRCYYYQQPHFVPVHNARKLALPQKEEPLFPLSPLDEIKLRKGDPDDALDSATYYMKRKLGRKPGPGKYVIQVSSRKDDVRIVKTRSEQKQWGTNLMDCGLPLFRKYKVVLDPDGIHAKVVIDPGSMLVAVCANCGKYIELDDLKERGKKYFCCQNCKNQFNIKKQSYSQTVQNRIDAASQQSKERIQEMGDLLGVIFREMAF